MNDVKYFIVHWLVGFFGVLFATAYADVAIPQLAVVGGFGWWFTSCQIWRTRKCTGRCKGTGRIYDPAGDTYWRSCGACKGSGRQFRWFCFRKD